MNNITKTAKLVAEEKENAKSKLSKNKTQEIAITEYKIDMRNEIESLNKVQDDIHNKYKLSPAKEFYDAIVSINDAIRCLKKINK